MKLSRRSFITTFFLGSMGVFFLDAYWFERYIIDWEEFDISENSPAKIKTIQLSDLHIHTVKSFYRSIAERVNEEKPDILFFTGDSVNNTSKITALNSFLGLIDSNIQKVAILGNKEYSGNTDLKKLRSTFEAHNGKLLVNENLQLTFKNRKLNIIGIDDYLCAYPDFLKASEGLDTNLDTIVLNHCPEYRDTIDEINKGLSQKVKLVLCGHTHGGQVTIFGKEIFKPIGSGRYLKGWYKNKYSKMYVSRGIGTSVLPLRLGSRAEAIIFYV